MPTLGPMELIVILAIVILIFGAGKVGEIGGALGKGIRDFRKATSDDDSASAAAPVAAMSTGRACRACGNTLGATQTFCGSCGTKVAVAAEA